jgi:protein-tyrosine phosphatase
MKIYEILPRKLYQSRTTVGIELIDKYNAIKSLGINTIVNLWKTRDTEIEKHVQLYIHWPLPDGSKPDIGFYEEAAREIAINIDNGGIVLTHCHAGVNRSGLMNAIVVMFLTGMSGKEAKEFIMLKRPKALNNEAFCNVLDELYLERQV